MNLLSGSLFHILALVLNFQSSDSFTSTNNSINKNAIKCRNNVQELYSITKSQTAVIDGSSFNALELFLAAEGKLTSDTSSRLNSNRHGYCSVIAAKLPNNERVVGIKVDQDQADQFDFLETVEIENGVKVYKDSLATIPNKISDEDAISTCIASLTSIHCALNDPVPYDDKIVKNVGGSSESFVSSVENVSQDKKKAVVVGGSDYASFIADGLAAIGAVVTQVSTNKMLRPRKQSNVSISPPAVGELSLGFASAVGKFNVLVDTLSDEAKAGESMCIGVNNEWDDFGTSESEECSSAVIMQLKRQHQCSRYISTMCNAQKMVRDNGLIFGRNDAQKYTKEVGNSPINNRAIRILPPKHFGPRTLQTLLNSNILFKNKGKESSWIQGWSMKDYWELTSWPRDVAGAANVRFGFPVVDDLVALFNEDDDESKNKPEEMILAPPLRANGQAPKAPKDKFAGKDNPFIFNIKSVGDLSSEILGPKKKCVLFLSSTSCRTCKYLTPQYTKLSKDFQDKDVVFAKVNAFSKKGKELSRVLEVDAVPAFVMFRDGKRFGTTMSLTRIPSKKLNLALELLTSGDEWDAKSINKLK